jgi:hypothetical protein
MASNVLAKMAVLISAQTAEFNKAMAASSGQLNKFQTTALNVNKTLASVGVGFGLYQVVGIIQSAIGTIKDFEAGMSEVKAITGATTKEFNDLRNSALDLGKSTRYTAQQVAGLQLEYGRLGFSTKEILAASKATLSLATATGEDLAKSADVAGSTIRGFGLSATETLRVVDVMAESFNKSALSLENFSEAMKYVAPVAAQAGLSVEETTALLGTLADAGIRGSQAGTSLRKIISDLGGESGTLAQKLQKLADKGLTGAEAMSEVGRTAYASLLVLAKNTEKTDALTTSLNNAAGAAKKAADIMSDNLAGDLTKLSSAYDAAVLSGSGFTDSMRDIVQAATTLINVFSSENNSVVKFLQKLVDYTPNIVTLSRAINFLAEKFGLVGDSAEDQTSKLKAIENTVKAAFDSGNVDAYIRALDTNIYKEEIIAEIRRRQSDEVIKGVEAQAKAQVKGNGYAADSLEALRKRLTEVTKAYDSTSAADQSRMRILGAEIAGINELINKLERLKSVSSSPVVFKVPDTKAFQDSALNMDGIMKRVDAGMQKLKESTSQTTKQVSQNFIEMSSMIVGAISTVAESLGALLVNGNFKNFGQSILKAVASFAKQFGEALIAIGIGMQAAKLALKNPIAAIGAGIALVALAGALNAAASSAQSNFNGGGGGSGSRVNPTAITYGDIGQQLVAVINQTEKRNRRNRG